MIARSMQSDSTPFSKAKAQSVQVPIHFCRSLDNRISRDLLEDPIEKLKALYEFIHPDEILAFLRRYPFLIADLKKISEIKSQYFGEAPMTLYYMDEPGWVGGATLAAYIQTAMPREQAREMFSLFDEEWWSKISEEAQRFIAVDREAVAAKEL